MSGYVIVKEEKHSFWSSFLKIFNLERDKKIVYDPYKSKTQVSYVYRRNLKTHQFPPISIEIFVGGKITDNLHAIIEVPCLTFNQWTLMSYRWDHYCWKIIIDFDINKDIRSNSEDNQVEVLISTA